MTTIVTDRRDDKLYDRLLEINTRPLTAKSSPRQRPKRVGAVSQTKTATTALEPLPITRTPATRASLSPRMPIAGYEIGTSRTGDTGGSSPSKSQRHQTRRQQEPRHQ